MSGAPDFRKPDLPNVAASVLLADQSITGVSLRSWSDGADTTDATTRSLSGTDVRSLAGTRPAAGAEAGGDAVAVLADLRLRRHRCRCRGGARATSWDSFDPSAATNIIVTAAIVGRDDREAEWQDISMSNRRCPSTKDDLVRTIVVIPQTGPDPGPPSYAQEIPVASTSRIPITPPTSTHRNEK